MIRHVKGAVCCTALTFLCASRAWAGTPADRYQVNAAGDLVTDTRTGLVWQRTVNANSYAWDAAKSYCSGLGGGWRLPALKELLTLVDPTRASPSIDPAFAMTPAEPFWTASPYVPASVEAWFVKFDYGESDRNTVSHAYRVRCVH